MTNLGHDLIPLVEKLGIALTLPILNDPPMTPIERRELFQAEAGRVELVGRSRAVVVARCARSFASAKARGRRPIAVLPSPGHPSAVIGAARGFIELVHQIRERGDRLPGSLFISAAAGTTVTGFLIAEALFRAAGIARMRLFAVQVSPDPLWLWLPVLLRWSRRALGLRGSLPTDDFEIVRSRRNLTFGRFDQEHEKLCERVKDRFGMVIDPLYGGKTWSDMERLAPKGSGNAPVLFWHCGYTPDWRAFRLAGSADAA
jgi:1-aminocyclopropane-1-carboxylate deaminase/D-cysteine desulfhydrase-like pyridoxal-dependent ACC family enzyme